MNKVVRLPDGRFITRKLVESNPAALAAASADEIWTMNDGKSNSGKTQYTRDILIRDMETSHLINAINTLYRKEYARLRSTGVTGFSIIDPDKNKNSHTRNRVIKSLLETCAVYRTMRTELDGRIGGKKPAPSEPIPQQIPEPPKRKFDFSL